MRIIFIAFVNRHRTDDVPERYSSMGVLSFATMAVFTFVLDVALFPEPSFASTILLLVVLAVLLLSGLRKKGVQV